MDLDIGGIFDVPRDGIRVDSLVDSMDLVPRVDSMDLVPRVVTFLGTISGRRSDAFLLLMGTLSIGLLFDSCSCCGGRLSFGGATLVEEADVEEGGGCGARDRDNWRVGG